MEKPNFFIVGAPKCGTTSLASWLSEHPDIYMSPVKDPHHYNDDFSYGGYKRNIDYFSLFGGAKQYQSAIVEASVWYLYSTKAIPNIEIDICKPKYIVMLRNPIEMALSLHGQLYFSGDENIKLFESAWAAQIEREKGNLIPKNCREPKFLLYEKACSLGGQLERVFDNVSRDRVLPVLLEDVKKDPRKTWLDILSFLSVPDDGREDFPVKNEAKERRSRLLVKFSYWCAKQSLEYNIKPIGSGFLTWLNRRNIRERQREEVSPQMKAELIKCFEKDVLLLGKLINRDLTHWLK